MPFGPFKTPAEKLRRQNNKHYQEMARRMQARKEMFRAAALSKLSFLYPDMQFCMNMQCRVFCGFSPSRESFVWGYFDDDRLPCLEKLREEIDSSQFTEYARRYASAISNYEKRGPTGHRLCGGNVEEGYVYLDYPFLFELRLSKNGIVIARSNPVNPKSIGYFAETIYRHVVQDIRGNGVSQITLRFYVCNWGEDDYDEVSYVYQDSPRKEELQNREHYVSVCSLFLPFLRAAEPFMASEGFHGDQYCCWSSNGDDAGIIGHPV